MIRTTAERERCAAFTAGARTGLTALAGAAAFGVGTGFSADEDGTLVISAVKVLAAGGET